jgi:hypothetical protein
VAYGHLKVQNFFVLYPELITCVLGGR